MTKTHTSALASENFVDTNSAQNFAIATAKLTFVLNLIFYCYKIYLNGKMPETISLPTAVFLCIAYVLSFHKKDEVSTIPQYAWIVLINSLILFTSITGTNGLLIEFSPGRTQNESSGLKESSISEVIIHLVFPSQKILDEKIDLTKADETIQKALITINTADRVIQSVMLENKKDSIIVNARSHKLRDIRESRIEMLTPHEIAPCGLEELSVNKKTEEEENKLKITIDTNRYRQQQQLQQVRQQLHQQQQQLQYQQQQIQQQY